MKRSAKLSRFVINTNILYKEIHNNSRRIRDAAESQGLLPETQIGNRPHRSTELAVKLVVDATHTAWRHGAVVSLLQLDIKGAYDRVNYIRLLYILQQQGFPV